MNVKFEGRLWCFSSPGVSFRVARCSIISSFYGFISFKKFRLDFSFKRAFVNQPVGVIKRSCFYCTSLEF